MDLTNLSLPDHQDALIEQVAAANPRTVVVLETGTAVTMPWLDKVAGVVEAWYAGSAGHKALANVIVGEVNPSGKLSMTFPKSESDLPRPVVPPVPPDAEGQGNDSVNTGTHLSSFATQYDEGPQVGYKWYEAQHKQPLFAFGFGLSYTSYTYSGLTVDSAAKTAHFIIRNTGKRAGTEIAEVYATLPKGTDEPFKRLVGWKRVTLAPGESQSVAVPIDDRVLQTFDESKNRWNFAPGEYEVVVGSSSVDTPLKASLRVQ
jgi:beta-glucosidase